MANHKSCIKKRRVSMRRHSENLKPLQLLKSNIKKLKKMTDKAAAQDLLKIVYKQLDKAAMKRRIHRNKAARLKRRYALAINKMA